jgi:hypothetical protein
MNKKNYQKPTMTVETFDAESFFCTSLKTVSSEDTGITYGGGSTEQARSRSIDSWGIEEE